MAESDTIKLVTSNRKARHEYFIVQSYEAGIVLTGTEVKSLRAGKCNLTDSYALIDNGEIWLTGFHISEFTHGNLNNHDPMRKRKLLLNRSEIRKLQNKVNEKGCTLIVLSIYFKNGNAKAELALAKGKKLYDKRETIAKKDLEREMQRKVKL
ncbi:SsrA-binding protein [uncultured bacterium]|nr:SsrA-binding protein [uncultured bacterium]